MMCSRRRGLTLSTHHTLHTHLQEFVKGLDIDRVMPLWTWEEMDRLRELLYKDKVLRGVCLRVCLGFL